MFNDVHWFDIFMRDVFGFTRVYKMTQQDYTVSCGFIEGEYTWL